MRDPHSDSTCPMARAIGLFGDQWSLLVVREALDGAGRYEQFRDRLAISDHTLSRKLGELVDHGVLERVARPGGSRRLDYRLTPAGRDLAPVLAAFGAWGHRWLPGSVPDRRPPDPVADLLGDPTWPDDATRG